MTTSYGMCKNWRGIPADNQRLSDAALSRICSTNTSWELRDENDFWSVLVQTLVNKLQSEMLLFQLILYILITGYVVEGFTLFNLKYYIQISHK